MLFIWSKYVTRQNSNALFANMLLMVSFNVVTSVFPSLPIALTQNIELNVSVLGKWLKTQIWIMIMIVWFYLDLIKGWLTLYVDVHTPSTCSVMCFIWGNILLPNIMEFSVCKFFFFDVKVINNIPFPWIGYTVFVKKLNKYLFSSTICFLKAPTHGEISATLQVHCKPNCATWI